MLKPTIQPLDGFTDSFEPATEYRVEDVRLEIPDSETAIFRALLLGPEGVDVYGRAWLSKEKEGTLVDGLSEKRTAGEEVEMILKLHFEKVPELACFRVESEPTRTKHTVHLWLTDPRPLKSECEGE